MTTVVRRIIRTAMACGLVAAGLAHAQAPQEAVERGFYLLPEFHAAFPEQKALMEEFLTFVQSDPVPVAVAVDRPLRIAWLGPSIEVSDAWGRLNMTIRGRLADLEIPFQMTEFIIHVDEHERQATQIQQVLAGDFDYVVIGPSEYLAQKAGLEELAQALPTLIMNVVNPFVDTYGTPRGALTHIGFDHSVGAQLLCEWAIEETGGEGTFALLRYLPGLIDSQRSDYFSDCVQANSNLRLVATYEANGDRELAFTGANAILSRNPDITMLHAGSTAVALGAMAALDERGMIDQVLLNGWGGGQNELDAILDGKLDVTAYRVNDDWGVSVAEAIKAHLEGREIPAVIAATMKAIDYRWTADEVATETAYGFRYSGRLDR
jgi:autoinducer 2-binding periplasmic protein LuxP